MEQNHAKNKEYQTVRLFATLGTLTLIAVLLFKVVLFGPTHTLPARIPAETVGQPNKVKLGTGINLDFTSNNSIDSPTSTPKNLIGD